MNERELNEALIAEELELRGRIALLEARIPALELGIGRIALLAVAALVLAAILTVKSR